MGGNHRTSLIVNVAPGTDEQGEMLSALRFAARASKVQVRARVTRYVDYETLYHEVNTRLSIILEEKRSADLNIEFLQNNKEEQEQMIDTLRLIIILCY